MRRVTVRRMTDEVSIRLAVGTLYALAVARVRFVSQRAGG